MFVRTRSEHYREEHAMPVVELPQGRVHYTVAGPESSTRPSVIFSHGLLVDGTLWQRTADALAAQGIRSVSPDLPLGSHRIALSADADLSPRGVAQLMNDLLAALELTDVTLVGNDTGGALCQFLIDDDASRIGRLVLTNCDAFDQFPPPPFGILVAAGRSERRIKPMLASMKMTALRHSMLGYGGLAATKLDPQLTRAWIEGGLRDADVRRDTAKFMRGVEPADLLDVSTRLTQFGKPVSIVWGDADRFFKFSMATRLREAFADASLHRIEGARTFVALDAPEQLAAEIAAAA
jgi:pimeloyl-ACP methyl ester carboxylesterase